MLDKQKTYMVLNYDTSPIAVTTRHTNELIPAGDDDNPTGVPFSLDDISYINSTTKVFKIGRLFFEEEYQEEIYDELRIRDWKDIMTNREIYDIILNPTVENLERVIAIDDPMYFDRIYGAYIGLVNTGVDISLNVSNVLKARRKEFASNKRKSAIELRAKEEETKVDPQVEAMQKQIAEMQAMIAQLTANKVDVVTTAVDVDTAPADNDTTTTESKPKPKKTSSKSGSKKSTTATKK